MLVLKLLPCIGYGTGTQVQVFENLEIFQGLFADIVKTDSFCSPKMFCAPASLHSRSIAFDKIFTLSSLLLTPLPFIKRFSRFLLHNRLDYYDIKQMS